MAKPKNENEDSLKKQIENLEAALSQKTEQLARYQSEVADLNRKLEVLIDQIGGELKIATLIQRVLVPTAFPNIPGFEFSTKFVASPISGGDYFDIFELEDRFRFGILLSSSSGHGVSSLFLSVLMKLMGTQEARRGAPPHEVLGLLGRELIPHLKDPEEAHAFYAIVDRRTFDLFYCQVGNLVSYVATRSDGDPFELVRETGPFKQGYKHHLQSEQFSLSPRDRLVLCSESIVRGTSASGEEFGHDRLKKIIRESSKSHPHELRNEILFQAQHHRGSTEWDRDATVVVAEVKDRVLKLAKR